MKTVLAPSAPWPTTPKEKPKAIAKKKPPKKPSKRTETDKKFTEWASKNLGANHEIH
jgi:hypothetical protein